MLIKQPHFMWHVLDSNTMLIGIFFPLNNRGLETGVRDVATHVLRNGEGVFFAFSSPYHHDNERMNTH
jgi:hypothetical protein